MKVKCSKCGTEYSDGIHIENSTNVTLSNNYAQCPRCGTMNKGISGTFSFDGNGNVINSLLDKARLTAEDAIKLRTLLQTTNIQSSSVDELSVKAQDINSGLTELFQYFKSLDVDIKWIITTLIAAIGLYLQYKVNTSSSTSVVNNYNTTNITVVDESYSKRIEREMRERNLERIKSKKTKNRR